LADVLAVSLLSRQERGLPSTAISQRAPVVFNFAVPLLSIVIVACPGHIGRQTAVRWVAGRAKRHKVLFDALVYGENPSISSITR
jgi:hypothetical protein